MAADSAPSHFDLFELPVSFDIDIGRLDARYRELQRSLYPDRFVNAGDRERLQSVQQATQVNEAYRTLKDPLLRGRYLLQLGGYAFDDEHHTTSDVEFRLRSGPHRICPAWQSGHAIRPTHRLRSGQNGMCR